MICKLDRTARCFVRRVHKIDTSLIDLDPIPSISSPYCISSHLSSAVQYLK